MSTIFLNLFGGPGSGKSTMCADVFTRLKKMGINCEMALEYAKDAIYEESYKKLNNQIYIFGKQHNRIWRLNGKVDVVVTDSPILVSILYDADNNPYLKDLVMYEFKKLNTLNFYINREFEFSTDGRIHNLEQSKEVDNKCVELLDQNNIQYTRIGNNEEEVNKIVNIIVKLNGNK